MANQDFVLHDGDRVVFGLNTDLNELSYVFKKTSNRLSKLSLVSTTLKRKFTCMKIDGRHPLRYHGSRVQATPTQELPSPTIGKSTLPDSSDTVDEEILSSDSNATVDCFDSSPIVQSPIAVADSSNDVIICSSPPRKKPRTNYTLDSLFDAPTAGSSTKMEEELFGQTPTLTPRARAVLKGIGMTATDIQVELARNEIEKEKKIIESKYQVLQNELASKEQKFIKTQEKVKLCETIEQELICVICQELLIRAHTLSCSHSFCEYCITKWQKKNSSRFECPVCRTVIKQKPVRSLAIDNIIRVHVANLPREQQVSRRATELEHYKNLGLTALLPPIKSKSIGNASSLGSAATPIVVSNSP